jgi:hypothetical protein
LGIGEKFAKRAVMTVSLLVGRSAAVMWHPVLAWERRRRIDRVALIAGYAAVAYVTALFALLAVGS